MVRLLQWLLLGFVLLIGFWGPVLAWVAWAPIGILIAAEARRPYLSAWLCGLAFFLAGVSWLPLCDDGAGAKVGWVLLAVYLSLYFPGFLLLARACHRGLRMPVSWAMPVCWTALEYVRMHAFSGFGWLMLGHAVHGWTWVIQIADLAGVYGVSFVVALVNGTIADMLLEVARQRRLRFRGPMAWRAGVTASIVAGTCGYGYFRVEHSRFGEGPRLLLIQTDLKQSLKTNEPDVTFEEALTLTSDGYRRGPVDLIVWPETSFPYFYADIAASLDDLGIDRIRIARRAHLVAEVPEPNEAEGEAVREVSTLYRQRLQGLVDRIGTPLLIGVIRSDFRPERLRVYNSAVLFVPGEGAVGHYDKLHLVPFGEYLPLESWLPLRFLTPYETGIDFGLDTAEEFRTLHHGDLHFATLICFEDTLPHLAREFVRRETAEQPVQFFVNQSNDGWFRGSFEPDLHLWASVFRAVECRRALVRVCNTGVTALVDGNGRVADLFQEGGRAKCVQGSLSTRVPLDDRSSPYVVLGDWLPWTCLLLGFAGVAASLRRRR